MNRLKEIFKTLEYNLIGTSHEVSCLPQFPQAFTIVKLLIVTSLLLFCIVTTPIVSHGLEELLAVLKSDDASSIMAAGRLHMTHIMTRIHEWLEVRKSACYCSFEPEFYNNGIFIFLRNRF